MKTILEIKDLTFHYNNCKILDRVSLRVEKNKITAIYGDSGSGKSTILSAMSLMFREIPEAVITGGEILFKSKNILELKKEIPSHRRKVSYIYQHPNPLNKTIFENAAFPLKIAGIKDKTEINDRVTAALKEVNLYEQVKDRLNESAFKLSGGQKQKLCIARALVMKPDILLLDEPTSSLDSASRKIIEELILTLKNDHTIVFVSHEKEQISRLADRIYCCSNGRVTESQSL